MSGKLSYNRPRRAFEGESSDQYWYESKGMVMMIKQRADSMLILGTGAMASLFAARLASIGINVKMLGSWKEGLQALRLNGVRILDEEGDEQTFPVNVTENAIDCWGARYALVLVKTWQTHRVAHQLATCLSPNGLALTLQNGLGNLEILRAELGEDRATLGVTTVGATLVEPGRVKNGGNGIISLGKEKRLKPFVNLFKEAGFIVDEVTDTDSLAWGKLVINAAINPVTALLQIPNGEILERPAARSLMIAAARETAQVAQASGIRLPYPDPVLAVEDVARRTSGNLSSMLRDVMRGGPTEVDAINGAVVRAGERVQISTPVNQTLWQLVKSLEQSLEGRTDQVQVDTPLARKPQMKTQESLHHPMQLVL